MNLAMNKPTHAASRNDHRDQLIFELHSYLQKYPEEKDTVERVIDFVQREPMCFERTCVEGHITGSAWVVNPERDKVLLTHHRKLQKWLQVGGHADGDGNVLRVAVTEAREETGIEDVLPLHTEIFDLDVHVIPARKADPEHLHYDIRYALIAATENYVVSSESIDLAWVPVQKLSEFTTEDSMLRMGEKHASL